MTRTNDAMAEHAKAFDDATTGNAKAFNDAMAEHAKGINNTHMTEKELDKAIADRPYEKVTKDGIVARIKDVNYMVWPGTTLTLCNIELENGFSVRGEAACVDKRNFNMEIGQDLAYKNAFNKLWAFEGYLLAERKFLAKQ